MKNILMMIISAVASVILLIIEIVIGLASIVVIGIMGLIYLVKTVFCELFNMKRYSKI